LTGSLGLLLYTHTSGRGINKLKNQFPFYYDEKNVNAIRRKRTMNFAIIVAKFVPNALVKKRENKYLNICKPTNKKSL
jgi:hypothetical protein